MKKRMKALTATSVATYLVVAGITVMYYAYELVPANWCWLPWFNCP